MFFGSLMESKQEDATQREVMNPEVLKHGKYLTSGLRLTLELLMNVAKSARYQGAPTYRE